MEYDLELVIKNCPTNLQFYSDSEYKDLKEIDRSGTGEENNPKIAKIDAIRHIDKNSHGEFDETVYWKWEFETTPGVEISDADLIDSEDMGKIVTASISVTGFEIMDLEDKIEGVAEVDGKYYDTLQEAINAVPTDNIEKRVRLFKDTTENIKIPNNKNIVLNLQNHTITNSAEDAVITNSGTVKIINGTINMISKNTAAVNNNSTGRFTMSGGKIIVTAGGKQAIYNDKGFVEITGSAYLKSEGVSGSNQRATIQNQASGTLLITGGTIISTNFAAIKNDGSMTIGVEDGKSNHNVITIQGGTYGVTSSTDYGFYGGTLKGKSNGTNNLSKITSKEENFDVVNSQEVIDGVTYRTVYLAKAVTVTFDPNGGSTSESSRNLESESQIGVLPTATRQKYVFDGWFTEIDGGEKIDENTVVVDNVTYYAHWTKAEVAEVNGVQYDTLQDAVNAVPKDNTATTISIMSNTNEAITVSKNQNIIFDLQDYKMINNGNKPVITNNGTVTISNGTVESDVEFATIDNNAGAKLILNGGRIVSTGTRSAIYNVGGTVEISGNTYLISTASGSPNGTQLERGTINNIKNGIVKITSGTIIGVNQQAISNEATLIIGTNDGSVSTESPTIIGKTYGIRNVSTFKLYDGIIKGEQGAVDGAITETEENYELKNSEEVIDDVNYKTGYLGLK